jgi:hypothetical protein
MFSDSKPISSDWCSDDAANGDDPVLVRGLEKPGFTQPGNYYRTSLGKNQDNMLSFS